MTQTKFEALCKRDANMTISRRYLTLSNNFYNLVKVQGKSRSKASADNTMQL